VLADRLEAFTVTKIGPALTLALFLSPAGARYGLDAWRRHRFAPNLPQPTHVSGGSVRFFQIFLVVFYSGSGLAKLNGDWTTADVLWSHVHDNYETFVSHFVQRVLPAAAWGVLQWVTLTFEVGAPLWFALPWTRTAALCVGLGMHAMIGLMFGPVIWFSCLMSVLLIACYAKLPRLRA
jgi:Vitamin K-dependent gamma-carboxylase